MISAIEKGEYDIIIGTQMISKGLDFPKVTLVGVVNADESLNIPDFRSGGKPEAGLSGPDTEKGCSYPSAASDGEPGIYGISIPGE